MTENIYFMNYIQTMKKGAKIQYQKFTRNVSMKMEKALLVRLYKF